MNSLDLYSVNDLMVLVAECLEHRDPESAERLERASAAVRDWLQPEAETTAQLALVNAALVAVLDLAEAD